MLIGAALTWGAALIGGDASAASGTMRSGAAAGLGRLCGMAGAMVPRSGAIAPRRLAVKPSRIVEPLVPGPGQRGWRRQDDADGLGMDRSRYRCWGEHRRGQATDGLGARLDRLGDGGDARAGDQKGRQGRGCRFRGPGDEAPTGLDLHESFP
ncbi:hypothetical protein KRR38_02210 [Novosphingobium sp. G106]|uniref:hypothetical protein n=1 Tax=Novosphingobium sp. G106 TaxID=2849500 RepID=UPI001C2CED09|nr:hypothetical protein [Novosphingobium sp. G106]MBV1686511.1 hypothetical protein [Novosphingobium sp. G106]